MKKDLSRWIQALEVCGLDQKTIAETAASIERHQVNLIYWNDTDKDRIILHAFRLRQTRILLESCLAKNPGRDQQDIIAQSIHAIDEHFSGHQWPTAIAEDDPALLRQLGRQKHLEIDALRQSPDHIHRSPDILRLQSDSHRLLRILLKLPAVVSIQGHYEPVVTRELVAVLHKSTDPSVRAVIEEELQTRYPDAYGFLAALYGRRNTARLHQCLDLEKISSRGFLQSMVQTRAALINLTDNLEMVKQAAGKPGFSEIVKSWNSLDQFRLIAVLNVNNSGVCFGRYHLDYPLEYSDLLMPPWMQDSTEGELHSEISSDQGTFVTVFDRSVNDAFGASVQTPPPNPLPQGEGEHHNSLFRKTPSPLVGEGRGGGCFGNTAKEELNAHYLNIQDHLIKPNYDALQLIVAHADKMTKMTAQTILFLLASMVEAYRKTASPAEGDAACKQYQCIHDHLEAGWNDLSDRDELPEELRRQITRLQESPLSEIDSAHSLIRFLHEAGNQALEKRMVQARADITIAIGAMGVDGVREIQLAKLDNAPIVVNGLIRHPAIAAIVQAARRMPGPIPGAFVVINHHVTYSVRLGEHRAEFSANLEHPDQEGFVRLQSYQGGIDLEQQLRAAFVERVLREQGMMVKCEQEGLIDSLVTGILDKDSGARTRQQIEDAVIVVLRLIGSLRDLDYAMAYLFSREKSSGGAKPIDARQIDQFAASFASLFLVEGMMPFAYNGGGMPFAAYCEYTGPRVLADFKAYQASAQRMFRYRLYFAINALLRTVGLPIIQPGKGGIGQEVIDQSFNKPLRHALARRELRFNDRGFLEKNPDYQPIREIISRVITHENDALRMAILLNRTDLYLHFSLIGSIDQLLLMRAQQELAPDTWLVVYGLADEENHAILYAFSQYLTAESGSEWLSVHALRKLLRQAGYQTPQKLQIPGFQRVVSHRLLIGQPHDLHKIIGASVRGLSASMGDGSARIGRITFDRHYYLNPQTRDRRILLVPFTTPEDLPAIRAAEAVLVTSGGLLSHAGVTTREFAIPSLILPHAEWLQSQDGVTVRLEERHPGQMNVTLEGFWVSHSIVADVVEVHEGDMVLVWASQGFVSILPMSDSHLEQVHGLIQGIIPGDGRAADLELQLQELLTGLQLQDNGEQVASDMMGLILVEALWDRRVNPELRRQLISMVKHFCDGVSMDGRTVRLSEKSIAYPQKMLEQLTENALTELEGLLSEIEHHISKVNVLWRALGIIAVAERHWAQVVNLTDSLGLSSPRLHALEKRMDRLRSHPRVALLRASVLHEVEALSFRDLTEADLPIIRQTLRRLGHQSNTPQLRKILLVCTANVDRSPMAEFLLRKMLADRKIGGVEVFSRGVSATDHTPISKASRALLLTEDGVDAEPHRSQKIAEADVQAADLVLAMEQFQVDWLKEQYPQATGKIFLLSDYGQVREIGDIKDPAGQLDSAYHQLRRELQLTLAGAFRRMQEEGLLAQAMVANLQRTADRLARLKRRRIAESGRIVVPLAEVDADFVDLVGGKGANLGEIAHIVQQHGACVPPALMVTTLAFDRFLAENRLLAAYQAQLAAIEAVLANREIPWEDQHGKMAALLERIRQLILQGRLDPASGVGGEIMDAVRHCGLQESSLSVRSSGLQEDTEEASFAGAAETYLYVRPDELLESIKKVWTSFWLVRGVLYRHDRILRQGPVKPAVVVQQMFDSQVSGVIFTTDPVSDRDVIVIEAGYGLGEGVVSGLVDVDRYYINKFDGSVINLHIGRKAFKVTQHPSGQGTRIETVDNALRDTPCLNEDDIRIQLAMALEEHYALSQDIEFGIAHGQFNILQTRPVTTRESGAVR